MQLNSSYENLGAVSMPDFSGRQLHMHTFDIDNPSMPQGFEDYLQVVNNLCKGRSGQAYLTVDEKVVEAGSSQRRGGAHVDGRWMPDLQCHGGGGGHLHENDRQAIIVASSEVGCVAYEGKFDGVPKDDGDLEHIREQLGEGEVLKPNCGYLLSPDCVHESIKLDKDTKRSFVRIALEEDG